MSTKTNYKERLNGPFMWLNEALNDAKRFYIEDNAKWVNKMAIHIAEYAIILAQYADDWQLDKELTEKFGQLDD